jgi:hypothetical protein
MYSVEADRSKRLVVISASGDVTKAEVKAAAQEVRKIMKDAEPGFRVLTDFRWLQSMEPTAAPHVAEIMDAVAEKKVASVTRVVPDPKKDIGLNISRNSNQHLREPGGGPAEPGGRKLTKSEVGDQRSEVGGGRGER